MNNELMFSTGNNETETAWDFFTPLHKIHGFTCDLAALITNRKFYEYYGPDHEDPARRDVLAVDWPTGMNWLNPPYSDPEAPCHPTACKKKRCLKRGWHTQVYIPGCIDFVRKASEQRALGITTMLLLAARTDTKWFHQYIYDSKGIREFRTGVSVDFLQGRLKFEGHATPAPFPSMLVTMRG